MNKICCLDLEGVLVPEIWIKVSEKTKIRELRLTTRDIPDYDALMKMRLKILRENKIKLRQIQRVTTEINPWPGARAFLDRLRSLTQVIILSDTFYEFSMPLMKKLGHPSLFCNWLETDRNGFIRNYVLRQKSGKQNAVLALKKIGFMVKAVGDSYNDIAMLKAADQGILFKPPSKIISEFPGFRVVKNYNELLNELTK